MTEIRGLDQSAVAAWIAAHVAEVEPPLTFALIAGGHSNLTYGVTDAAGRHYVVRRGPLGRTGGGAHDMGREYRVIAALAGSIPVPRAIALCDDESVNGAAFYVMSRVEAAVLDNVAAADTNLPDTEMRRHAGEQVVDVLVDLHRVDVDKVGLARFARREDFLDRQITRFTAMWRRNQTRDLPAMDGLAERLRIAAPEQWYTGVVHGDYRIGNVMIDGRGDVAAVLDWELWTLGDVLADLGFLLNSWYEPDDPDPLVFMEWPPTITGEFGSRDDVLERYAARTGFDVSHLDYYRAFQHWRMAVIAEGVKMRYDTAQMASDEVDHGHLDRRVVDLVQLSRRYLARYVGRIGF
jgi:aminoglycoside phosphotransferase (APT) family kinase protein